MVRQDEPQGGPPQPPRDRYAGRRPIGMPMVGATRPASPSSRGVRLAASVAVHLAERGYSVDLLTPTPRTADAPHW